ncbi:MAG: hypothetical protein CME15_05375 [Gemmatimonadetes bacterium]|nr:hypothetical protein [Gemmatimonadota bacterium]
MRPVDGADRERTRTELDRSQLCLAGAGAGKTHELVERMAACVSEGFAPVERLAAITFTRKAAGEMRGRLFLRLRQLRQQGTGDRAIRLRAAVRNIDQCYIGTIHSFCARLLRERPVEAGLTPDFAEVEEREELTLLRAAWDGFLKERAGAGDERLVRFDELGVRAEDFYPFFMRRCQFSDLPLKESTAQAPDLDAAVARILAFLDEVDGHVPDPLPRDPDRFMQTAGTTRDLLNYASPLRDGDRAYILAQFLSPSSAKITLNRWNPNVDFARTLRDRLLPQLAAEIEPVARQWRQYLYRLAAGFVDDALSSYRRQRMMSATLTFQDLLELSAALLRDSEPVRSYFQQRYRVIFVDEFQDTDPLQAQMVLYLTGSDNSQRDWRQLEPRPGSLFVVGDEQQSIYRFRRADVEIFRTMADRLVRGGGEVVRLTASFRSRGGLCSWINSAFGPLFAACDRRYQAEFQALHSQRPDAAGEELGVRALTHEKEGRFPRRRVAAADASRIAGFIAAATSGRTELNGEEEEAVLPKEASPGDFMILTRTTGMLSVYARALEARSIPYDVTGAGSLRQSVELRALVDMLEAIYDPRDPLPLTAFLRGPLVGLGDDELYDFRQAGGVFNWRRDLPAGLDPELADRVQVAFQWLERAWNWVQELTPAAAVERLLTDTGLLPLAAAEGSSRAGALLRVLALVRAWESRRLLDWGQVLAELRDLIEKEELKVEEMSLETGRDDVVRLMNLHQAKGLEARVVFLADPCDSSHTRHEVEAHVSRLAEKPYLSMVATRKSATGASTVLAEPEGWVEERAREEAFLKAEELRLLYVAATRARDLLVVSRYLGGGSGGPWSALDAALESVLELQLVAEATPAGEYADGARMARQNSVVPLVERLGEESVERDRRWQEARVASHEVMAVTAEAEAREMEIAVELRGRGREFGALVHRLFEAAVKGHLPQGQEEAFARSLAAEESVGGEQEKEQLALEAVAELNQLRSSQVWEEMRAAEEVFAEVPMALSCGTEGCQQAMRGIIDLVYRVAGKGWKIVDYKTDRPVADPAAAATAASAAAASEALIARYGTQVATYASYWHTVTGEEVVEKGLWSRETGYVPLL